MKNIIIKLLFLSSIVAIAFLVLQPKTQKKHTQQEMENISKAFSEKLAQAEKKRAEQKSNETVSKNTKEEINTYEQPIQQSIIAIIYKKPKTTWFIKAKDTKGNIDTVSASFKNYFVDQLKFKEDNIPDFSHIPESMKVSNKSGMRLATYMIGGVEVSVTQLNGQQNIDANINRWMRQIGLTDESDVQRSFEDNNQTIIVKMPK